MSWLYDFHNNVFSSLSNNKSLSVIGASFNGTKKIFTIEFIKYNKPNKIKTINLSIDHDIKLTLDNETITSPIENLNTIIHHMNEYIKQL